MEILDISTQDISDDVAVVTAFFHIHLPGKDHLLSKDVARLVLIFRLEHEGWKIVHSGMSITDQQRTHDGTVYPLKSPQERNSELAALVEDRTQELKESHTLYRLLTEDALDVHWRSDANYRITYVSPVDERLRGFKADELIGHHVFEFFNDKGIDTVKKVMQQRQASEQSGTPGGFLKFEAEHRCKDGSFIWGEVMSKPERNENGDIVGYHGITREITERKRLEEQVHQLAFYDTLTQLANRRLLENRLTQAMSSGQRSGLYGALLFLDLDNFKPINDAHGHAVGDLLLKEAADRLKASVRETDTVMGSLPSRILALVKRAFSMASASATPGSRPDLHRPFVPRSWCEVPMNVLFRPHVQHQARHCPHCVHLRLGQSFDLNGG